MGNLVIVHRVPTGTGIMIPAPAPFSKWIVEFPIPIIRRREILSPYPPHHGYYPRVPTGAGKIDIRVGNYRIDYCSINSPHYKHSIVLPFDMLRQLLCHI